MIILQKIAEKRRQDSLVPSEWIYRNLEKFGLEWSLFPYQKEAILNIIAILQVLYQKDSGRFVRIERDKEQLHNLYLQNGLSSVLDKELSIKEKDENFAFLSQYFEPHSAIPFKSFVNRAAFWMATGSGKTLVMIKLLAILHDFINRKLIPEKDILILAPKDEILDQIKEHVREFNKGGEVRINLRNLKEWERVKNEASHDKDLINVFYYRADNIGDRENIAKNKEGQRISYESIYNNGNWYLILDEAHKGEKDVSKRQQYFMALTQNGFLFNFSATFTDELDIATTVFDYKLDTFLKDGYGKKLYIGDSSFKGFNARHEEEYRDDERREIIAETLFILALARKNYRELQKINSHLYHSPLLITLANSVNTDDADLKVFYEFLSEIARGRFNFERVKASLIEKIDSNKEYLFKLGKLDDSISAGIRSLSKEDFFENVFHAKKTGNIEVVKFKDNPRELAFKHLEADKYFMLIVASDIVKWENNALEGYQFGRAIEESFFEDINKRNDINILLGSRIFVEGWDTNRPNIINFVNIGVSEDAKKFVLQSIGRGIRIEPIKGERKRFEFTNKQGFSEQQITKIERGNKVLESLFIFATNKEVIKSVIEGLEKQSQTEWNEVRGVSKNNNIKDSELPLFVPTFKDGGLNEKPFWIGINEYQGLLNFTQVAGPKVLLLNQGIRVRTYKKILDKSNFVISERRRQKTTENILGIADNYFNETIKILDEIKVIDGEISHYQEIKTSLAKIEVEKIEADIKELLSPKISDDEFFEMIKKGKISKFEFSKLQEERLSKLNSSTLREYLDYEILAEHYYSPILFKLDTERFQHIIKNRSEIDFLKKLKEYLLKTDNELKKYDWWYFSKIDETIDSIGIPYFDSEKGEYRTFFPDFIFWFKKDKNYYLKFIDPKGVEFINNPSDKIDGFNRFVDDLNKSKDTKLAKVEVFYYNDNQPGAALKEEYRKYWTNNFDKIFSQ